MKTTVRNVTVETEHSGKVDLSIRTNSGTLMLNRLVALGEGDRNVYFPRILVAELARSYRKKSRALRTAEETISEQRSEIAELKKHLSICDNNESAQILRNLCDACARLSEAFSQSELDLDPRVLERYDEMSMALCDAEALFED